MIDLHLAAGLCGGGIIILTILVALARHNWGVSRSETQFPLEDQYWVPKHWR